MSLRTFVSWTAWPFLLTLCITTTAIGFADGIPVIAFNVTYFSLAVILLFLERVMPHEVEWTKPDGQIWADIAHTLLSKGTVQTLIVFSSVIGLAQLVTPMNMPGHGIWPRTWPMWAQVLLAVIAAEFGLYWGHHIAHKWKPLWRFHAIHHSVKKLWVVNTGRFHFVDSVKSIVLAMVIMVSLGAPMEVVTWFSAITAYVGILTHCNVEMRFGWLSLVFNTPELHRWHHSKDLREGDKNFGENIMLWDWVFGTWFNEKRRPPVDIGIKDDMPPGFRAQLAWPFRRRART
jgi:sterol desaturase/sphingolipid hydroxylase (fatty acid hydroxylase superfamily)